MLQIENISFSYGKRRAEVFHDFSLSFEPGHIYGLLGKNGNRQEHFALSHLRLASSDVGQRHV